MHVTINYSINRIFLDITEYNTISKYERYKTLSVTSLYTLTRLSDTRSFVVQYDQRQKVEAAYEGIFTIATFVITSTGVIDISF